MSYAVVFLGVNVLFWIAQLSSIARCTDPCLRRDLYAHGVMATGGCAAGLLVHWVHYG